MGEVLVVTTLSFGGLVGKCGLGVVVWRGGVHVWPLCRRPVDRREFILGNIIHLIVRCNTGVRDMVRYGTRERDCDKRRGYG